jgi:glyoxylase-like metal-dependent hydrolase (beta-lactamase superfamily II)/rhodanese-related sulfurtransferase
MTSNVVPVVDEGLGNSAYLVDLGDGRALVVDPERDPRPYQAEARRRGLSIAYVAETHLHADFVSGARELAAGGATILASAAGDRAFAHRGLHDGDEFDLGGLRLRALATPGHTPEHIAYLLLDGAQAVGVFTGGTLLVGAVARTDLISPERADELARAMYHSITDTLLQLPDDLPVYPTHGAGSFCSAPAGGQRTTTIARERAANPFCAAPDEDAFVSLLLSGLGSYPSYFRRLTEVNRRGPRVYGSTPAPPQLDATTVRRLIAEGATVVDARPVRAFAAGHVPGSVSIELRPAFATWLGWVVDGDVPVVLVLDADQDRDALVWQALTVGYENLAGELRGGIDGWRAAGFAEQRIELVSPGHLPPAPLVDVRQAYEYAAGHIPGALSAELGGVERAASGLPPGPLTVTCGHAERAMTGASLLERSGRTDLAVVDGGTDAWAALPGNRLQSLA